MHIPEDLFIRQGQPCNEARLAEIENNLGIKLPADYREFLRTTGGGDIATEYSWSRKFLGKVEPADSIECIYGNGSDNDSEFDLDGKAAELSSIWELPKWGILIAEGVDNMHTPILMNINNPNYPPGSIIVIDLEVDEKETLLYNTFEEMLTDITDPYTPTDEELGT